MTTEYVVLAYTGEEGTWAEIGSCSAASTQAAVKGMSRVSGAYVAIPKRSFQQVLVEVETAPRVKILSGEGSS